MGYRDYIPVVSVTTKEERPIFATHVVGHFLDVDGGIEWYFC